MTWGDWAAVGALPTELAFVKFRLSLSHVKGKALGKALGKELGNCLLITTEY